MEGNSRDSVHRSAGNSTLWYFQPEQAGYLGWQWYYLAHYLAEGHGLELMLFYLLLSDWFSLYLRVSREGSWGDARIDGLEYKQCVCRQTLHATITLGALSIIHFYSNGNAVCSCIPPRTHVHSSSQLHLLRQFSTGTLAPWSVLIGTRRWFSTTFFSFSVLLPNDCFKTFPLLHWFVLNTTCTHMVLLIHF